MYENSVRDQAKVKSYYKQVCHNVIETNNDIESLALLGKEISTFHKKILLNCG